MLREHWQDQCRVVGGNKKWTNYTFLFINWSIKNIKLLIKICIWKGSLVGRPFLAPAEACSLRLHYLSLSRDPTGLDQFSKKIRGIFCGRLTLINIYLSNLEPIIVIYTEYYPHLKKISFNSICSYCSGYEQIFADNSVRPLDCKQFTTLFTYHCWQISDTKTASGSEL